MAANTKAPDTMNVTYTPLTRIDALTKEVFHQNGAFNADGTCRRWHRNGNTRIWSRPPRDNDYRIPVKHGMYSYDHITQADAYLVHTEETCPFRPKESN